MNFSLLVIIRHIYCHHWLLILWINAVITSLIFSKTLLQDHKTLIPSLLAFPPSSGHELLNAFPVPGSHELRVWYYRNFQGKRGQHGALPRMSHGTPCPIKTHLQVNSSSLTVSTGCGSELPILSFSICSRCHALPIRQDKAEVSSR